ncbi:hypothetical protein IV203_024126 [Nitzschia inconspicua]|uniref:Uncharacterized protein n=1 Tax=Nitzschia inconspicua TaxID=303405 RepID=A0A9K3KBQ6_9STRA|nr:hypothetical protein IV203_024573 [Nitzschia inconspicua]KAG7340583.1 hypothetical protein IV203_024126 [Nitzschia inconspicua]
MTTSQSYGCFSDGVSFDNSPETFYVFIVGNCEEYPENRREQGDLGLYHEYLDAGVPGDQVCYVKDDDCTVTNCQAQLEAFLQRIPTKKSSSSTTTTTTFLFYYGGHGIAKGFRTIGGTWLYEQMCRTVHQLFHGDRVLFLIDCCDSGNVSEHFPSVAADSSATDFHQCWVLFANAPPFIMASDEGEEWVVTNSWIRAMRCATLPTLTTMMEFLADRLAVVLGDQGFGYIQAYGSYRTAWDPSTDRSWMPRRTDLLRHKEELLSWPKLQHKIPKEAQAIRQGGCNVGDSVVYKHGGGLIQYSSLQHTPPMWVFGKVIAEVDSERVQVQVHHPSKPLEKWTVTTKKTELISGLWMGQQWSLTKSFYKAQVQLAKDWKYLHFSALSVDTPVTVQEPSNDCIDTEQDEVEDEDSTDDGSCTEEEEEEEETSTGKPSSSSPPKSLHYFGPHIPVRWCDTNKCELIPLAHVISPTVRTEAFQDDGGDLSALLKRSERLGPEQCKLEIEFWQHQALLQSIKTAGKTVINARQTFGRNVKAYWPNEEKWYKAKTIDQEPTSLSLDMLASHARFPLEGDFTALFYDDDEQVLSPTYYIDKRRRLGLCC